jgi:hypothetical protein
MPKFMFLMHDQPAAFAKMTPDEMQKVVQRYIAWGKSLRARKRLEGGHKLANEPGRVMRKKRDKVLVSDGPYAESREVLGGYFLVKAKDYDDAAKLAADCPHLDYGGAIEVRQVDGR